MARAQTWPRVDTRSRLDFVHRLASSLLHGTREQRTRPQRRVAESVCRSRDAALPYGVRDRRSVGDGSRDRVGWGNAASITISVVLAFLFGYALTLGPILRAGVPVQRAAALTVASDTVSIATMELVDNAFILIVPGAIAAGLSESLFWWSLFLSLVVAIVVTVPVNRWLIARGRGNAIVHGFH